MVFNSLAEYKISNLVDKSLVTIVQHKQLKMHDLLKEMGRSIESAKGLEERTRIWNLKDVTHVSKNKKESSMIEAINVNLSQVERISEFDCSVFARLDCFRFLEFHHHPYEENQVRFCWEGFGGFPEELRYFRWDAYPQNSLPSNFCVENVVELHMPRTTIRKLWTGKQNIVSLKVINLEGAKKLVEFPDVSEGRNIERINLDWCKSLVKLSPSIQHLPKLKILSLQYCPTVESVPTTFDSKVLEVINLIDCGGIKMFPQVASQGNIIRELYLDDTDIREVPSPIELLKGLKKLSMSRCEKLSIISTNICKLKSLFTIDLSYCTNLESFPESMEPMESLKELSLNGCTRLKRLPNDHNFHNLKSLEELHLNDTAITELPSSIQHLICLEELHISRCQNLTSLPSSIHNLRNLTTINASGSGIVDLPESIDLLFEMKYLYLRSCERLRSLPASLKQLSQLLHLDVAGCSNLCSLPELPSSLEALDADGCVSLKTISSTCLSGNRTRILKFASCFESDEEERRRVLDIAFSYLRYSLDRQGIPNFQEFKMMLPWSEMPQWFCGSQSVGSSLTLKLPINDQCFRLAFCVVLKPNYANSINAEDYSDYSHNYMNCYVDDDAYELPVTSCDLDHLSSDIEHLLLWHNPWDKEELRKYFGREVSFQFGDRKRDVEVTKCGVLILSIEDIPNAESYS